MEHKKENASLIQNISLFLLGILFIGLPVIFATVTTNPIILPKQILLAATVGIVLLLQAISMISEKTVIIKRTYFDVPIILFGIVVFLSSIFAVNQIDSLMAFVPLFVAILTYFLIVNIGKDKNSLLFLMSCLVIGAVSLSFLTILSFFKIYVLPFPATQVQSFTPLGSMLDQAVYIGLVFAFASYYFWKLISSREPASVLDTRSNSVAKSAFFGFSSIIMAMGIIVSLYLLFAVEKPPILPFETGFQTAVQEIALDSGRVVQGFLLGSGFGTYPVDFSRWKPLSFNQNPQLWNLTFFRSSSFILDLAATTGILGLLTFLFIVFRALKEIRKNTKNLLFISVLIGLGASFLLPINFIIQSMVFVILGFFAAYEGLKKDNHKFFDVELQIVAFKKGLIALDTPHPKKDKSLILPVFLSILIVSLVGVIGFYSFKYILSDITFQKSLISASQNNGNLTYEQQVDAINTFPWRDGLHRVFSQTNLALANSIASQQSADKPLPPEQQQNIITLIQQSINSARRATTLSPQTYLNWQNLSSIYRSLIGFGENAENFAIATAQQSISLDVNNPQQYINLGGIYYQLQQWDMAENQFRAAVNLKPDFANSRYNLGHALEQKGDLANALREYQAVKSLVANDKNSLSQIEAEIAALQKRIEENSAQTSPKTTTSQPTLNINTPPAQLPKRDPQVKIPAPDEPTPTVTSSPSPTPQP